LARVSVVVPTRDRAAFIADAIDSALGQTLADVEVIVVDDGSTDGTPDLLRRRYGDAIRLECLGRTEGRSTARNIGASLAEGELIAFLDSDDIWYPDKLERQVPRFADPGVDLVHAWIQMIDERGTRLEERSTIAERDFRRALARGYDYAGVTETWCMLWTSAVVVRRSALIASGGFDPALDAWEDWDLWWRIALAGGIATTPEVLVGYRVHDGNTFDDLGKAAPPWLEVNRKHLALLDRHPNVPSRRRARRNLCVNMALGEHWLGRERASRHWMRRAIALDPSLLRRPAHPVWAQPLLSTLVGRRVGAGLHRHLAARDHDPLEDITPAPLTGVRSPPAFAPPGRPTMTIVVISHQRRDQLQQLLRSLLHDLLGDPERPDHPDIEGLDLVVVLDGSTDGSRELLDEMELPFPLQVVWQANRGRAVARNAGLRHATGDVVLFLDDDGIATDGLLEAHRRWHAAEDLDRVVIGPCDFPDDFPTLPVLVAHSRRHHAQLAEAGGALVAYHVTFANTSVPRRLLVDLGGFDEEFAGWGAEDGELGARLLDHGVPVLFDPDAVVWHDHRGTRDGFLRSRSDLGENTARLLDRHPELADAYLVPTSGAGRLMIAMCRPWRARTFRKVGGVLFSAGERVHRVAAKPGLALMWLSSDALQAGGLLSADPSGRWLRVFASDRGPGRRT
jgi:glycosyltransferase involved in cell wall biosynthesis